MATVLAFVPKQTTQATAHVYHYTCPCPTCHARHTRELADWRVSIRACRQFGGERNVLIQRKGVR